MSREYDEGDEFEAARYGLELPKKYPGQTIQIIGDNLDNPRVEYSQIEHLLTGKVYFHGSEWKPQSPYPPWSCPRCSRIYGPSVQICVPCNTAVAAKEAK